jgi:hypothetical protein
MWRNPGEIPGNGIDDDGNGYADDVYGIDVVDHDSDPMDVPITGVGCTGTHMAGIIGAEGDNGIGVAGVNWQVRIMAIRVMPPSWTEDNAAVVEAMNYLALMKRRGVNLRVVSLGSIGKSVFNQAVQDACETLAGLDVLLVGYARSGDNDISPWYPQRLPIPNMMCVAASDSANQIPAGWGAYGRTNVDLAAPSPYVRTTDGTGPQSYATPDGGLLLGAPHVAGAAALLAAAYPQATAGEIKAVLLETVDQLPVFTNKMVSHGRLNLGRALQRLGEIMTSPPWIDAPPQSQTALAGGGATFAVQARGARPLAYQWFLRDTEFPGATNATLVLSNVTFADTGPYTVVVSNAFGTTNSEAALTVVPLIIMAQPQSTNARPGAMATFSVMATSTVPMTHQWLHDDMTIAAAGQRTLAITNVQLSDAGTYAVVLANSFGALTSATARLKVLIDPLIVQQPCSASAPQGGNITLSVVVTNTATLPIGYRWRRGGTTLTNLLLNERVCFLTVTNLQATTNFSVVLTNEARTSSLLSSNATVTVLPDSDGDGMPDIGEPDWGSCPGENHAAGDCDGDGLSNLQEYLAGTDPTNALSHLKIESIALADGSAATLKFFAESNKTYTVQYREALDRGQWLRLADVAAGPSRRIVEVPGATTGTLQRFYRLVSPRVL